MAQDYTSIRVSQAAFNDAKAEKRDDETWDDYIRRCTENPPPVREFVAADEVAEAVDVDALADALETVEERTGRMERTLEDMGAGR